MNRGQAERAVSEDETLSTTETALMMMLLRRAHNDTLEVPGWRTPALPQLAAEVKISVRWAQLVLAHIEKHGWLKRVRGNGRGRKYVYTLLPDGRPQPCDRLKGCSGVHPLRPEKVNPTSPITAKRVNQRGATPQVSPDIAPRDTYKGGSNKGEGLAPWWERRPQRGHCDVPGCALPGRLYPGGFRCDGHKPRPFLGTAP